MQVHFFPFPEDSVTSAASRTAGVITFVSCLQDFTRYKLLAGVTLDSKLKLVVSLAVRRPIFADVFSAQNFLARFTLEAAEMPLPPEG